MAAADVAVYAPNAGAFYGGEGVQGGAELQSYYIARALASAGVRVRHVVADAKLSRTPGGVDYGVPGIRRRMAIVQGLRRSDASLYIQRTAGIETGYAGVYARLARRQFVFSSSSDADFMRDRELLNELGGNLERRTVRIQVRIGMACAHAIVAQTEQQAELARGHVARKTQVIPSFCELVTPRPESRDIFLWIGAFVGVKDPHAFVDLAERVPEATFVMVARERKLWDQLAASVRERAARTPNVELLPPRPRDELTQLYGRALAVVSTSLYEGFSNVFLEGWARGVPSLSLRVDPDGVITRHGLGSVAGGSIDELARICRGYVDDRSLAEVAGDAGYRYVRETHAPDVVGPRWLALVEELLRGGDPSQRAIASE
jgi:glycosyltransferase involved in cell wall biosynthesis